MKHVLALVVALGGACGPSLRKFTVVSNGGPLATRGSCSEVALVIADDGPRVVGPGTAGCTQGEPVLLPVGGAIALWRIGDTPYAGPANANRVELKIPQLVSGEGQRGLASGAGQRALVSGEDARGLQAGGGDKGLVSGEAKRGLASGGGEKGLQAGGAQKGLVGGEAERGLQAGGAQKGLVGGEAERGLGRGEANKGLASGGGERGLTAGQAERLVVEVRKSVEPDWASREHDAGYTLAVTNVGAAPLARMWVADRVSPHLRARDFGAATASELPDGSTLLLWRIDGPIEPQQTVSVAFRVTSH